MMKKLLTGNEAVSRGAYEGGVCYAAAYPGTPSTEILENLARYKGEIIAEWASNEKVALEAAIGASVSGARSLAAMKHVGVNVAADPLLTFGYTGVNGGMVLVSADDPGMHSSQNEQDNRYYAKFAKIAMLEPSNSQEAKDMVISALEISEAFDTPTLLRMTTRICHSKTLVELGDKKVIKKKEYVKNIQKYYPVPAVSRRLHRILEDKLQALEDFANETPLNYFEWNDKKIGVISSGVAYQYAKEVFGDTVSYLKLGFTNPLPMQKVKEFADSVENLYVIEELEPFMEEQIKAAGIKCIGKEKITRLGELNPEIIAEGLLGNKGPIVDYDKTKAVDRPPTLCAGCPHRGFFYILKKNKNIIVTSDIGCYGLGAMEPLNAADTCICMGGSISMGHGAQQMFNKFNENMRTISVIGDSTFLHTGINSLMTAVYNKSKSITCILDNRITGMTGHQENPGTGLTLQGDPTTIIDIEALVKSLGVKYVRVVNPLKLAELKAAFEWALGIDDTAVIISRWPCVLKKHTTKDREEFGDYLGTCRVDESSCTGCKLCIGTGCPALRYSKETNKVKIDETQCTGCRVCAQVCNFKAIRRVDE